MALNSHSLQKFIMQTQVRAGAEADPEAIIGEVEEAKEAVWKFHKVVYGCAPPPHYPGAISLTPRSHRSLTHPLTLHYPCPNRPSSTLSPLPHPFLAPLSPLALPSPSLTPSLPSPSPSLHSSSLPRPSLPSPSSTPPSSLQHPLPWPSSLPPPPFTLPTPSLAPSQGV